MTEDEKRMAEALELARRAEGRTRPNPAVGCVIVRNGEAIGRGFHRRAGEAHAEVDALASLPPESTRGATLYVNLEPCCVHGRTPPCTDAIIEAGIARVVIGAKDTNPRVQGGGIAALERAGIEVVTDVLYQRCRELNAPYYRTMEAGLPFVAGKWAMSLDGKIATRSGDSSWISGEASRAAVHELRNRYDAVMVGTGTLRRDDPRLTCRIEGGRDPVRVVLDASLDVDLSARIFERPGTIVATSDAADAQRASALEARGATVLRVTSDDGRLDLRELLERLLSEHDVMSVLVEGGGDLLGSLFDANLLDRVYAFVAPTLIGGREATPAIAGRGVSSMDVATRLRNVRVERYEDDVLITGDLVDVHGADHRHREDPSG